jgi:hypothetical protein
LATEYFNVTGFILNSLNVLRITSDRISAISSKAFIDYIQPQSGSIVRSFDLALMKKKIEELNNITAEHRN